MAKIILKSTGTELEALSSDINNINEELINYNLIEDTYKSDEFREYSNFEIGTEGFLWDATKGSFKAVKNTAKAGGKAYGQINKQYGNLKNMWTKLKPVIIKTIKQFGTNLGNMYAKFMKFDKDYQELSKKIDFLITNVVPTIEGNFSGLTATVHNFYPECIQGYCGIIKNYDTFLDFVNKEYFDGKFIEPDKFYEIAKSNNKEKMDKAMEIMTEGMSNINASGELTVPYSIWNSEVFAKFFRKANGELKKLNKQDVKSTVDFVKLTITGVEAELKYESNDVGKFKSFLIGGPGSYLMLLKGMLNNRIIEEAMKKGAGDIKKSTDLRVKELEKMFKDVSDLANKTRSAEQAQREEDVKKANLEDTKVKDKTKGKEEHIDQGHTSGAILEAYVTTYNAYLTKTSAVYQAIAQGLLSGVYTILSEARVVVDAIDRSSNRHV